MEQGEDGFLISEVVGLPGCRSQARTVDELITRTREAILLYLSAKKSEGPIPKFVGLQQVELEV